MNISSKVILVLFACGLAMGLVGSVIADEPQDASAPALATHTSHVLDGWALGGAYNVVAMGSDGPIEDTLRGPALCIVRHNPGGIGLDMAFTYILPTGSADFTGLSADVAITYGLPLTPSTLLLAKGGAVAYVGGDRYSSSWLGGDLAIYPGIGIAQRVLGPLTLTLEVDARFWLGYDGGWTTFGGRLGLLFIL